MLLPRQYSPTSRHTLQPDRGPQRMLCSRRYMPLQWPLLPRKYQSSTPRSTSHALSSSKSVMTKYLQTELHRPYLFRSCLYYLLHLARHSPIRLGRRPPLPSKRRLVLRLGQPIPLRERGDVQDQRRVFC